ncbi:hypothetical protein AB0L06_18555 [Spirillospora sp. NPDC052269]
MESTGGSVAERAIEAAVWAPSVYNTQPWKFGVEDDRIAVRADPDRQIEVADPAGREMLLSCGAALYTLVLAIRHLGGEPDARLLPDPDRPYLLASVRIGPGAGEAAAGDPDRERMYEEIFRRRTHRGAFRDDPIAGSVLEALGREAEAEGARLLVATEEHVQGALAGLTQAADHMERATGKYRQEVAGWAPRPGSTRREGMLDDAYRREDVPTEPHFPARDFARGQGWGVGEPGGEGESEGKGGGGHKPPGELSTGLVALLVTEDDTHLEWLRAGQALQRVLLRAGVDAGLAAAFHTQALEIPELRAFIGQRFCDGAHPQMLMRLGVPAGERMTSVRRPVEAVTRAEPSSAW